MKTTESLVIARRQRELKYLRSHPHTTTRALANEFDVSLMTINRDLHMFIKKGLVLHDYSDVVWIGDIHDEDRIAPERESYLCKELVNTVAPHERVVVSASPITAVLVKLLIKRGVEVLTNQFIPPDDHLFFAPPILTGGQLDHVGPRLSFSGDVAVRAIKHFNADVALVYATGLSNTLLTTSTLLESIISRTMLENSGKALIFLADGARGKEANFMIVKREQMQRAKIW